ncbi:rapamycin-insensitive companion of mTOR [Euwallacea fornicatus]|uniref:rapamycin-insensitive companion of mTOR n=1 Tax=Euwallacea fornicatus TaxID=995702 RepID=UPI00338E77DC
MALSSWRLRTQMAGYQGQRPHFRLGARNKGEDLFATFLNKDPYECFHVMLSLFSEQDGDEKILLNHLNTFVKLLQHYDEKFEQIHYSRKDILTCLKLILLNESSIIRSAGLRCIRHTLKNEADVVSMNNLVIPFLISRSLDLKSDTERLEAIKLIRKITLLAPSKFNISMNRGLVSLANEGIEEKDRLLRVCLATLAEIGLFNPSLFIESGGVTVITRNLIDCQIPKIAESLCGILLLLLDRPETRAKAKVDLRSIAAPFCDFHYKHGWKDKTRDERKLRLNCSRLALLTILKSWPGLLHFCNPLDQGGFKAVVDVLYLKQRDVRKAVLDLLFDLLGLQQPEWTDELTVALSAIDPCEPQSSWRLKEGFVAAEGKSVLPHLAKTTPSPTEMHLALLLYCFLECGLLAALTEVITSSDPFISVRATVLLSELLRLVQLYLPPGCCNVSPSLPALIDYATNSKPQAMAAVTALQQLHKLMQRRPASYSLHLDYIIRNSSSRKAKQRHEKHSRHKGLKSRINQVKAVLKDGDDVVKETGVLSTNEVKLWNWNLIKMILRGEGGRKLDLTDSSHRLFLRRLLDFFTPSQKKYSHMDLSNSSSDSVILTTSGIEFIKYLGDVKDTECQNMVTDLFKDIHAQIKSISTSRSVHDCLFSPAHMINTHCQSYFLFIGQFVRSESGRSILESIKMFSLLQELATSTRHDCYVKLIISTLDYSVPGPAREILDAVLTCEAEGSRLYATQFLLVLLRVGYPTFGGWAVRLLCRQLEDKSGKVSLTALSVLQEACELPDCLETLTDLSLNVGKLGEKGELLYIRLLSTEKGFKRSGGDKILSIISKWDSNMNFRYVKLVESEISDSLTLHQRDEDGKYERVVSNAATRGNYRKDIFLPPHLYGQLNQHADGFRMLTANGSITTLVEVIHKSEYNTDEQILKLKAAIWVVGHFSTSKMGFEYLSALEFIGSMIGLATKCPVYGVRCTAFYALGLVASTSFGADELNLNGWFATRHNRHERWPVLQQEPMDSLFISYFTSSLWDREKQTSANLDLTSDDDEITLSEDDDRLVDYPASPALSPDLRKLKQLTLPASGTPPEVFHKRSLSESKTFDTSNGFDLEQKYAAYEGVMVRQRNSSVTESTTSGVSSCDSLPNRPAGGTAYLQTLSPIPSSTSLSILKLPRPVERFSHRISSNSAGSDVSSSLSGGNTNELSLQNMLGYQTIRYIRRRDSLNFQRTERDDYLFRPPPQTRRSITSESLINTEPSATIHYSSLVQQKFEPMYELAKTHKPKDAVYRGVCLPRVLTGLFPAKTEMYTTDSTASTTGSLAASSGSNEAEKKVWQHSKEYCLHCSQKPAALVRDFGADPGKTEILKVCERLANPVLSKAFTNHLLRLKQKDSKLFRDVCVYSEVCKMFSESSYSLTNRRVLHDLFLDVAFDKCFEAPRKLLSLSVENEKTKRQSVHEITSPTEFKTLDSLKLISVENKFPIRTRNNTN